MAAANNVLTPHEIRTNDHINRGFKAGGISGLVIGAVLTGVLSKQVFPAFLMGLLGAAFGMFTGAGIGACVGNYQSHHNPLPDGDILPANRVILLSSLYTMNGGHDAQPLPVAAIVVQPDVADAAVQAGNGDVDVDVDVDVENDGGSPFIQPHI
ncbi:MAG: hypothetical protein P1U63_05495 [Coxiellaceae bacterium]|nr:hypothetical protein [Coxiellaceae bacterium]